MTYLHLSQENMQINSTIATHDALIKLGEEKEKRSTELRIKEKRKKELSKSIDNFTNDTKVIKISQKESNSWKMIKQEYYNLDDVNNYVSNVNDYISLLKEELSIQKTKIDELDESIIDLTENSLETNDELTDLDKEYKEREKYWTNRVENLRNKCIKKNNIIKRIYLTLIFVIVHAILMNYIGIHQYLNTIYFSLYYIIYGIYLAGFYLYSGIYYIKDEFIETILIFVALKIY